MRFFRSAWRVAGKYVGTDGASAWVPDRSVAETWRGAGAAAHAGWTYWVEFQDDPIVWTDADHLAFQVYLDQLNAEKAASVVS